MTERSINYLLRSYVEQEIIPRYRNFDKAHNVDHAQTVVNESLRIASFYDVDPDMVYVAAAYHDTGLCEGRDLHHIVSARILVADRRLRDWFTEEQIRTMAEAAEDHRASSDHEPRSVYGRIVAEADRVIDPTVTLRRTVQYGLEHNPEKGKEWQFVRFREHLVRKYAPGGYLRLWIPESANAVRLEELRRVITDERKFRKVFDELFCAEFAGQG